MNSIFNDIIGHERLLQYLDKKLINGTIPQSILLSGSAGIGKTSIAKRLGLALVYGEAIPEDIKTKILNGESTNDIVLFNMSKIKNRTELEKVEQNFSIGLSKGRKVLILDEAHGLDDEQQDSLLVSLEHIPDNIYVILCTTDRSKFGDALLSRIIFKPSMSALDSRQIKLLIHKGLEEKHITFKDLPINIAEALIYRFCGCDARRVMNVMTLFENGKDISKNDLALILGDSFAPVMCMILELLPKNPVQGLEIIKNIVMSEDIRKVAIDFVEVFYGSYIPYIDTQITNKVNDLSTEYGPDRFIEFLTKVIVDKQLTQTTMAGYFIEANSLFRTKKSFDYTINEETAPEEDKVFKLTEAEAGVATHKFMKGDMPVYEDNK